MPTRNTATTTTTGPTPLASRPFITRSLRAATPEAVAGTTSPALITVTAGIGEPRYASLKGIMAARSKEVKQLSAGDLGIEKGEAVEALLGIEDAPARQAGEVVEDDGSAVEKIVGLLAQAKVV